jgi:hypothetical protein
MKHTSSMLSRLIRKCPLLFLIATASGALVWLSCEEVMDVSFAGNSGGELVVEGSITTDTMRHMVRLSYTNDYFSNAEIEMASDAEVSISDGDTTFILQEMNDGEYFTDSTVYGEVGKTYVLHIGFQDGKQFTATDALNSCADIDSIIQSDNYNSFIMGYGYDVLFYGQEPEPLGDNYLYLVYLDNVLYSDTISEIVFANDEFVNGNYIREFKVYRIGEADITEDSTEVTLEMHSISSSFYDFLSALMLETVWKGSPWDGPPASVTGNVSGGAKGFFRASAVKRRSKVFVPKPRKN